MRGARVDSGNIRTSVAPIGQLQRSQCRSTSLAERCRRYGVEDSLAPPFGVVKAESGRELLEIFDLQPAALDLSGNRGVLQVKEWE